MQDIPELQQEAVPYWEAFVELHTSRSLGFTEGPIPLSEIVSYFQILDIYDTEEKLDFVKFIRDLDIHYLEREKTRKEAEEEARKKNQKKVKK